MEARQKVGLLVPDEPRVVTHQPVLSGWFADAPARAKTSKHLGHSAKLGVPCCTLQGTNKDGDGNACGMHFLGYTEEVDCGLLVHGAKTTSNMVGDPSIRLSHAHQEARAKKVEAGEWDPMEAGCHGMSPIVKTLGYTDYNNVFVCCIAHAGLLGAVKDFWKLLLSPGKRGVQAPWYSIPNDKRRLMAERAAHITATVDQHRPYRCVVKSRGNWVMEDWLNWCELWSIYILMPEEGVS
jgi:hypothetical protein